MRKLITGIFRFACFFVSDKLMGGTDGLHGLMNGFALRLNNYLPKALSELITDVTGIVISLTLVYLFVSGLYRICTFNLYLREYDQ